ncbi:MAG: electron transport complex subunit E [Lachnospiraceae bacterium]|nr:electron transport complex subunit E [Lachnospiraceae bacterium]
MNKYVERLYNGIIKENPTFVLMLGMCPTLAVTTSLINGLGMGLTTTVVLMASNTIISLLRNVIPDKVRMPAFIVIVASFVTMVQFLLEAYLPSINASLGIYIPLIVVNCIILGRAESYASKNEVLLSMCDGIGMGLGFTVGLSFLGGLREIIGNGTIASFRIIPSDYTIKIIGLAPGAFFVLAMLVAVQNKIKLGAGKRIKEVGCLSGNCAECEMNCERKTEDENAVEVNEKSELEQDIEEYEDEMPEIQEFKERKRR